MSRLNGGDTGATYKELLLWFPIVKQPSRRKAAINNITHQASQLKAVMRVVMDNFSEHLDGSTSITLCCYVPLLRNGRTDAVRAETSVSQSLNFKLTAHCGTGCSGCIQRTPSLSCLPPRASGLFLSFCSAEADAEVQR